MRIGLALYGSIDGRSGGFRYDRRLVSGLRRAGDTVTVIELPWRGYGRGLADNASPRFWRRLETGADVLLQDELAHPSLVSTNRRLDRPIVSIVHHLRASEPRRLAPLYRAVERRYLDTVDAVICNSAPTRDSVVDLGVDPRACVVAPPAGDRFDPEIADRTIEERAEEGPLRVVFVGNVAPRKGLDTLVEAVARADAPMEVTVVGRPVDTDHFRAVARTIREQGLGDRIRMTGELADERLAETLARSHVVAVPSRHEGFGIVYLEGMSFGLPAVASSAGGARDVVTDGENGFLVAPDDPGAVAAALDRLAADRGELAAMGRAARRRYEAHPGWSETTDRVRDLLAGVARAAT
ncbi:glycosyltransferase family 4 protein [Saliphagus sp. LR7]|uniref:glycosyltransferase family 4 protein n=1 Tax=Saliphagus sp. LR7 TaxID=2282654 RepID=UPI000DF7E70E|nr:glycosyltransferase family 4 protein [Saliphagus sp. LR7]